MAVRTSWLLRVLLCFSAFLTLLLLWGLSELFSSREGVDSSSLMTSDLPEPRCRSGLGLLILVTSHPQHRASRTAIRRTWAQYEGSTYPWQVVFLVGRPLDVVVDWRIHNEQEVHGDILMGNYVDTYRNLTLKVIHGMKWAAERCQAAHVLKTDDDCYVNTQRLPSFLSRRGASRRLYVGSVFPKHKRVVIRDPASKWFVSPQEYGPEVYPPYASGIGYILSLDAIRIILDTAGRMAPIPVEDAYVGILADRAGITAKTSARFTKHNAKWGACNYRYLMVIHGLSPHDQDLVHNKVQNTRNACTHSREVTHWR
ncbi:beta-1,3-galactosyltransferase 5-like [Hyla sarda]|uniref:beta-1,3-galactosyltransferase 5-like n=1 Tax=Hyla sarda TaxID=327740 RepID=UPI0024C46017|nr:beta-1,3-galactosyltransferase 5-like [Hyla sarda]